MASWFETREDALLTMRKNDEAAAALSIDSLAPGFAIAFDG
jgi:hypothetical protein